MRSLPPWPDPTASPTTTARSPTGARAGKGSEPRRPTGPPRTRAPPQRSPLLTRQRSRDAQTAPIRASERRVDGRRARRQRGGRHARTTVCPAASRRVSAERGRSRVYQPPVEDGAGRDREGAVARVADNEI